jgi:RimJ/RimL family protein N-acetyltransferase
LIETPRLHLVPCTAELLEAFVADRPRLGRLLDARLPESWPVFPEAFGRWLKELRTDPGLVGWASWVILTRVPRVVVGDGGFGGRPDERGVVELGYAIVPEHEGHGYATEAAGALVDWALGPPGVTRVIAHTLIEGLASQRVLRHVGFELVGRIDHADHGPVLLWRRGRD